MKYEIYCDGSAKGKVAFVINGQEHVNENIPIDSLLIEYSAAIEAVKSIPENSECTLYTDSQTLVARMNSDHDLPVNTIDKLHNKLVNLTLEKNINITVKWVPRKHNKAGKLI